MFYVLTALDGEVRIDGPYQDYEAAEYAYEDALEFPYDAVSVVDDTLSIWKSGSGADVYGVAAFLHDLDKAGGAAD